MTEAVTGLDLVDGSPLRGRRAISPRQAEIAYVDAAIEARVYAETRARCSAVGGPHPMMNLEGEEESPGVRVDTGVSAATASPYYVDDRRAHRSRPTRAEALAAMLTRSSTTLSSSGRRPMSPSSHAHAASGGRGRVGRYRLHRRRSARLGVDPVRGRAPVHAAHCSSSPRATRARSRRSLRSILAVRGVVRAMGSRQVGLDVLVDRDRRACVSSGPVRTSGTAVRACTRSPSTRPRRASTPSPAGGSVGRRSSIR